jgi:hypothetical protein
VTDNRKSTRPGEEPWNPKDKGTIGKLHGKIPPALQSKGYVDNKKPEKSPPPRVGTSARGK